MKKLADRLAESMIVRHADYLTLNGWDIKYEPTSKQASYDYVDVELGDTRVSCQIADTEELQTVGLQKHAGLNVGEGMVFPYDPPRKVSFHMAKVSFPIDIVFINSSSKISKIVEDIEPGTPGSWGMTHTALVVEVPGGFCRENGIEVGQDAGAVSERVAARPMPDPKKMTPEQLEKTRAQIAKAKQIHQMGGLDKLPSEQKQMVMWLLELGAHPAFAGTLQQGVDKAPIPKAAQEHFTPNPRRDINPKMLPSNHTHDRFKDRDLVDVTTDGQPMDDNYDQTMGYDVTKDMSDEVAPVRPGR